MLFNSIEFLIFFSVIIFLYFAIPQKYRWILLLTASYYFYMCWKPEYILLILGSTLIDYFAGIKMGQKNNKRDRKPYLLLSLFTNLGLLFAFKYFIKYLIYILILGFVISLGLADWASRNYPSLNFYALPTRGWELLAGSILSYFEIIKLPVRIRLDSLFTNISLYL